MYLRLGQSVAVRYRDVIGLFDLDNTTGSHITRRFLERAEKEGRLESLTEDIPKSFVVCGTRAHSKIYFTQPATATLVRRAESSSFE